MQAIATLLSGVIVLVAIYTRLYMFQPRNNAMAFKITIFVYFATVVGFLLFDLGGAAEVRKAHVENLADTAEVLSAGGGASIGPLSFQLSALLLAVAVAFCLPMLRKRLGERFRQGLIGCGVAAVILFWPLAWVLSGILFVITAILLAIHDNLLVWVLALLFLFLIAAVINVLLAEIMLGVNAGLIIHALLLGQGIETFSFLSLMLFTFDNTRAISIAIVTATSISGAVSFLSNFNEKRLETGLSPVDYVTKLIRRR